MNILLRIDYPGLLDDIFSVRIFFYKSRMKNCSVYAQEDVLFYYTQNMNLNMKRYKKRILNKTNQ